MNPATAIAERLALLCRMLVPYALLAVLFILNIVPFNFIAGGSFKAAFLLMGVYYWSIFRPTLLPVWLVFVCGLLLDLLNFYPPGLNALIFVTVRWLVSDSRRFLMAQGFAMLWLVFGLVAAVSQSLQWLIYALLSHAFVPFLPVAASMGLAMALFPLVCIFLHMTHKALPNPPEKFVS